jgi:hypothetical protein
LEALLIPPFEKGGLGGIFKAPEIPLNPPFSKGDFKDLGFLRGFELIFEDNLTAIC